MEQDKDHGALVKRAQEASTAKDSDSKAVRTAKAALLTRITMHPEAVDWIRRGIDTVAAELTKQGGGSTTPPARQRSRSRSGGTAGDDADDDDDV